MSELDPKSDSFIDPDAALARRFESNQRLLVALALLAALFWTALYLQFSVDDAYISFRYGKTLVANHVWNWNPCGLHEEAYTSAIYTALGIVPALMHISPALFFKFFGLVCIAAMLYRLRTLALSRYAFLLGLLLFAFDPWVWLHSCSGLETPLYMLLILELAICVDRAVSVSAPWVYAVALLLPLTRPEGVVFAVAGVFLFWRCRGSSPKRLAWFAAAVLLGLLYFLARWKYFGHLLPNPFYVKVNHESPRAMLGHLLDNLDQFKGYFLTLILVILTARKTATRWFALCAFALILLLYSPHDMPMNYADRYFFQVCFPVIVFFFIAEPVAHFARISGILAAVFLLAISPSKMIDLIKYWPGLVRAHVDLGKRLAPFSGNHTMLAGDVGVIPYYSNWVTYDFTGLATNSIAQHGIAATGLEAMHPDLIILYNAKPGPGLLEDHSWSGPEPAASNIVQFIRESREYEYAGASRANNFYLVEFLRKDTPQRDQLLAAIQANTQNSENTNFSFRSLLLQHYVPWTE